MRTAACLVWAAGLAACVPPRATDGQKAANAADDGAIEIGLLLSDDKVIRWENFDKPLIERRIGELCPACTLESANAQGNVATQQMQVSSMITRGTEVLILNAVDSKAVLSSVERAHAAGIPVVAYDRLARGPVSAYVSFDNRQVGVLQGRGLLEGMGEKADGGLVVMMNGSPTDPNAALLREGALSVLQGSVRIGESYDTDWSPRSAFTSMSTALSHLGPEKIDGVYSANDSIAAGVIAAFKADQVEPLPPVTGQDAELAAVQRVLEGEQTMTVYKPFQREAFVAAEMALALGRGESLDPLAGETVGNGTVEDIPAVLADPVPVTRGTVEETIVEDGLYTVDEICTPRYASACQKAGLL